jgi:transposase
VTKSGREIVEILRAYDLTQTAWSAAQLAGCDPKTVKRYVEARDAGRSPYERGRRPRAIDPFLDKIEQWVDDSHGKIRADVAHRKLVAMGFTGNERSTRRAVAEAKVAWKAGRRRTFRPWVPEPGLWLQFDWGTGPLINGRKTWLFCAWLAWSRFRVVIPVWDATIGTLASNLDATFRAIGGVPTFVLSDNAKTVTVEHVAGIPVRHRQMVDLGRHYGCSVESCVPFDPETKGGVEATVKIAKWDLVPKSANLLPDYESFDALAEACAVFCDRVNNRIHRETGKTPAARLAAELQALHRVPDAPFALAAGEQRLVDDGQTIRFGSVRYSTPPGHVGTYVFCRVVGEELVITADTAAGLAEIARHRLSTPGNPRIAEEHYPHHPDGRSVTAPRPRPRTGAEVAFLGIGPGAERWLTEAAAAGTVRVRAKMGHAVELAALLGAEVIDTALDMAAEAGRFADGDLAAIADHVAAVGALGEVTRADEAHSVQPGTGGWEAFGR